MADKSPIAIGYVRVSTEEQATEGVSLDAQRAKVLAYCGLHGLGLAHTYADEGLSGKWADNRPGLQGTITHACEFQAVLVVYSLSRLARSTRDAIDIAERLAKSNADLVSITEKIDTTTSMGRFFFTTIAAWAQLERDQIREAAAYWRQRAWDLWVATVAEVTGGDCGWGNVEEAAVQLLGCGRRGRKQTHGYRGGVAAVGAGGDLEGAVAAGTQGAGGEGVECRAARAPPEIAARRILAARWTPGLVRRLAAG